MKALMKSELKRMLGSRNMILALGIGMVLSLWFLIQYVWGQSVYQGYDFPETVFQKWIGAYSFPVQSFLYYLLLPFIAVLPGGGTFYDDKESGLLLNFWIRCSKMKYLIVKYIAVFLAGGIAFVTPLIFNFIVAAAHFPALRPEELTSIGPSKTFLFLDLYYDHPWIYLILFLILAFLMAGGMAGITLTVSFYMEQKAMVLLVPFGIYFGVYCINNIIGTVDFAPNYFLISGMGIASVWEIILSVLVWAAGCIIFLIKGRRYEG